MSGAPTVEQALSLYASLMEEAKERLDVIHAVAHWKELSPKYATEFCALQFRMLCEIVALGSLVAHGDIGSLDTEWLKEKKWQAAEIMKALGRLHPAFFPRAHTYIKTEGHGHFATVPNALSKEAMTSFYGKLGDILHMGTLARKWSGESIRPFTYEEIKGNAEAINDLLKVHLITLKDGTVVGCILRAADLGGVANVFVAGLVSPPDS
ncbi:MAG: hypothetical protein HQ465_01710 [Rhodospirillales bacterium]|nr:hypothetical protein [Rhodospirillales bacterium]